LRNSDSFREGIDAWAIIHLAGYGLRVRCDLIGLGNLESLSNGLCAILAVAQTARIGEAMVQALLDLA
jgi:hypothetical protein